MKMKFKTTAIAASLVLAMLSTSIDVSAKGAIIKSVGKSIEKSIVVKVPVVPPLPRVKVVPLPKIKPISSGVFKAPKLQSEYLKDGAVKSLANMALDSILSDSDLKPSLNVTIPSNAKRSYKK